jgi:hypothetical protein
MKNAQGVAKVEKRREDARALRKLSRREKNLSLTSHVSAFYSRRPSELECSESSHRFWETEQ